MRIGHASIDENGKASNGKAGNQTGKEVCIRSYYTKNWTCVLRCKDRTIAEKMAKACEKGCNNKHIGYDQNQRNSLRTFAYAFEFDLAKIDIDCECDCSSFMTVCAECAGVKIPYSSTNAPTTRTMRNAFASTGLFDVLTESKYLTKPDYLKRGDILVAEGMHTVMVLDDGASEDTTPTLKIGSKGEYVKHVQLYLSLLGYQVGDIDGDYGTQTMTCVKEYQMEKKLTVDGIWGAQCWASVGKSV